MGNVSYPLWKSFDSIHVVLHIHRYWGEGGFFKIVRGINNLAIESECSSADPDMSDEELVWSTRPVYGGSIWGIIPFTDEDDPIPDINDITTTEVLDNFAKLEKNVMKTSRKETFDVLYVVIAICAGCFGVLTGMVLDRHFQRNMYQRLA